MTHPAYKKIVEHMWADGRIDDSELSTLAKLQLDLSISEDEAAKLEREVMGMTKEEALVVGMGTNTPPPITDVTPSTEFDDTISAGKTIDSATERAPRGNTPLKPGMRVGSNERYEIVDKIGEGGMGSVWRARDMELDGRIVAMKRIRVFDEADRRMLERFEQERRSIAGMNHANVVTVLHAGHDDHGPYLVMECIEGETLDTLLKREPLNEERAVAIFEGLCRGVAHAHHKGVIHRDIKPANVMLDGEGTPKLLDFGLARGAAGLELSMTGYGMGTLDYTSPEQKRDAKSVDHRADIYALGATFYELLTGLKPVPLLVAKVPTRWQSLVARCCEPEPDDRFQTATELLAALQETRQASTVEAITKPNEDDDDLRCPSPSCRRINAPDARFCHGCGESLYISCPACEVELRARMRHCNKCGAAVALLQEAKLRLEAARKALTNARLGEAQRAASAGLDALEGARLGNADGVIQEIQEFLENARQRELQAAALMLEAEQLEQAEDYENALWKLKKAANLHDIHAARVIDAEDRFPGLIAARRAEPTLGSYDIIALSQAARKGDATAQNTYGECLYNGQGTYQNHSEALKWFQSAADQGLPKAQYNLGLYYNAVGRHQSHALAVKWISKAAEKGLAIAQDNLGDWYLNGNGVSLDHIKAVTWFRMAAEQGNTNAQEKLGRCYSRGEGTNLDHEEAARWYRKAADQEHPQAQFNLAQCYQSGHGVDQDDAEAIRWYRKAADQRLPQAQFIMGVCYEQGNGVSKDIVKAFEWFHKAANQGHAEALSRTVRTEASKVKPNESLNWMIAVLVAFAVALVGWALIGLNN